MAHGFGRLSGVALVGALSLLGACGGDDPPASDGGPAPADAGLAVLAGRPGGPGLLDGPAAGARFNDPVGLAIDAAGTLHVADLGNLAVRSIAQDGTVTTRSGGPYTFDLDRRTGTWLKVDRVAAGAGGRVFALDTDYARLFEIEAAGTARAMFGPAIPEVICATGSCAAGRTMLGRRPRDLAVDAAGHVVVTASFVGIVETVIEGGVPVARSVERVERYAIDTGAYTFWLSGGTSLVDGPAATARVVRPGAIAGDAAGTLHLFDAYAVRRITPAGTVATVAGTVDSDNLDGIGASARFDSARAIATGNGPDVLVAQADGLLRRVTPAGAVTTIAGAPGTPAGGLLGGVHGLAVDAAGTVFATDRPGHRVLRLTADGVPTTAAGSDLRAETGRVDLPGADARFDAPAGVAVGPSGTVYVADTNNHVIRRIAPDGTVGTVAGAAFERGQVDGAGVLARFDRPRGIAVDARETLYVVDATACAYRTVSPEGIVATQRRGDGGCFGDAAPAAGFTANAIALGPDGEVSVAYAEHVARRDARGTWTVLARPGYIEHLAADRGGVLYAATSFGGVVLRIDRAGAISVVAGNESATRSPPTDGLGDAARFARIGGLAVDARGRVHVSDANRIRRIGEANAVTTVVGSASAVGVRPGALPASLHQPAGIAFGPDGSLHGTDTAEHLVFRAVLPP
jgi:sugar lactone lactonase YvrE